MKIHIREKVLEPVKLVNQVNVGLKHVVVKLKYLIKIQE